MIVPSDRVQSRVPGFEEKTLVVIGFETNDLDVIEVYVVTEIVEWTLLATLEYWSKPATALFVLRNSGLTINSLFPRPKERDDSDRQKSVSVQNQLHTV